jgi:hypothetical protein
MKFRHEVVYPVFTALTSRIPEIDQDLHEPAWQLHETAAIYEFCQHGALPWARRGKALKEPPSSLYSTSKHTIACFTFAVGPIRTRK